MKHSPFRPFVFVAILILATSLACGIDLGNKTQEPAPQPIAPATQPPAQPPVEQPSVAPPTATVAPPTATVPPASPFFKETFDTDVLGNWSSFVITGDSDADRSKSKFSIENGRLVFDLNDEQLYAYLIYDKQTYDDVKVELSADNRGRNTNNISLICRYSDAGWYEFSITSSGLFQVWAYDAKGAVHKGYNLINSGGSNAIKMGKETNVYAISCVDNHLTLTINGEESADFTESKYGFRNGKVGINISSLNVIPVIVEIDYFDIQQP